MSSILEQWADTFATFYLNEEEDRENYRVAATYDEGWEECVEWREKIIRELVEDEWQNDYEGEAFMKAYAELGFPDAPDWLKEDWDGNILAAIRYAVEEDIINGDHAAQFDRMVMTIAGIAY